MNFFLVTSQANSDTNETFIKACEKNKQVNLNIVDIDKYPENGFVPSTVNDAVYRVSTKPKAKQIELEILKEGMATFYKNYKRAVMGGTSAAADEKIYRENGIPTPKTLFIIPPDRNELESKIDALNGPPYIIKVSGQSHGVGVMKVDSLESLFSVLDYLRNDDAKVMIRQFIPVSSSARLIVLGHEVIDSIEYQAPKNEFRSNVGTPQVTPKKFPAEIEQTAVKAVQLLDLEFGGVDILIHEQKHYLTETNFPCFFPRAQQITGTDIAGKMVDYLYRKQNG